MTGPEHYAYAEQLLALASNGVKDVEVAVAGAQVHATLALVAATALTDTDRSIGKAGVAWREVVS